jgi:hypothetical protein
MFRHEPCGRIGCFTPMEQASAQTAFLDNWNGSQALGQVSPSIHGLAR